MENGDLWLRLVSMWERESCKFVGLQNIQKNCPHASIYEIKCNMQSFKVTKTTCQMVYHPFNLPTNQFNEQNVLLSIVVNKREKGRARKRGNIFFMLFNFCQYHNLYDPKLCLPLAPHGHFPLVQSLTASETNFLPSNDVNEEGKHKNFPLFDFSIVWERCGGLRWQCKVFCSCQPSRNVRVCACLLLLSIFFIQFTTWPYNKMLTIKFS